ncbi:histone H1-like [Fundulus diaphanus]
MAEEAPAAAPAKAPAKAPKKKAASKAKKDGPSLSKLIVAAVAESKERKGMSLAALKKVLAGKGVDVTKANKRINTAVTKLATAGTLSQTKGTGASGSFKLAKESKVAKPAKKVVKKKAPAKAKKPAATAAKKASTPKKTAAKKPAAKKTIMGHHHAQRHPAGPPHPRREGLSSSQYKHPNGSFKSHTHYSEEHMILFKLSIDH